MQRKENEYPKWGENHCSKAKTIPCLVKHHTANRAYKMEIRTRLPVRVFCEPRHVIPCIGNLTKVPHEYVSVISHQRMTTENMI